MKRLTMALPVAALVLVTSASLAVANQAASRWTELLGGEVIVCPTATYEAVSGQADYVLHVGQSASGNANLTTTLTFKHVIAQDVEGGLYAVRGAVHYATTANANTGGAEETLTETLQIVSLEGGGSVGTVSFTTHVLVQPNNLVVHDFNFGDCTEPND
jgi:hypothetical protein